MQPTAEQLSIQQFPYIITTNELHPVEFLTRDKLFGYIVINHMLGISDYKRSDNYKRLKGVSEF